LLLLWCWILFWVFHAPKCGRGQLGTC
jgi:hypothetical protein